MNITVKLYLNFKEYLPKENVGSSCALKLSKSAKVEDVINQLRIPKDSFQLVLVNGSPKHIHEELRDGDVLAIFPAIGGG